MKKQKETEKRKSRENCLPFLLLVILVMFITYFFALSQESNNNNKEDIGHSICSEIKINIQKDNKLCGDKWIPEEDFRVTKCLSKDQLVDFFEENCPFQ